MYETSVQHFGNFLFIKCAIKNIESWIGLVSVAPLSSSLVMLLYLGPELKLLLSNE